MFVAQAHSFRQQARLAITLAWVAGYTNLLAIATCGLAVSHLSGTASTLGLDAISGMWDTAGLGLGLLVCFFLGAGLSSVCSEISRRRGWESIYVLPMTIEAALLCAFAIGVEMREPASPAAHEGVMRIVMACVASGAMGLQNATITRISSGVVRTTHITGVVTDLGLETGQMLLWLWDRRALRGTRAARAVRRFGKHPTMARLALLASIIGSFMAGAALGAWAFEEAGRLAMFPPVVFLLWVIYQDLSKPIAELEVSTLTEGWRGISLPREVVVVHLKMPAKEGAKAHRMPNLLLWAERLSAEKRVVVLDLSDVGLMPTNNVIELKRVAEEMARKGRRLVVAGITAEQFQRMEAAGPAGALTANNVCADVELAVARAMALAEEMRELGSAA